MFPCHGSSPSGDDLNVSSTATVGPQKIIIIVGNINEGADKKRL